ncbi:MULTISPECIES: hypothetical protein [Klebsiella]|uniref:Uncharacterized protein n=2 Tax=Klebsiella/Raoultella group TaxID=2890311 RepID=A0A2J5Q441_9ENTR|nr:MULTISPECIES: hypothetical protein [Klebsiella]HBQ8671414.1 hypothetical protein [Klebsiella pneumoniae]ARB20114.1 hypothetical protein AM394_02140 [Klebsiella oxytoca]EKT8244930.1 hypothetical protein [Klebsiella oxytoca]EKW0785060.1 hypothetical protein [Klebsiella michiganensis]ELP0887630.1 hypothetical protein [Klebsiella oxytoca]
MTPEIRRRIHAFRNALVLAADTRSNECFRMDRWKELNAFPHGCCDLASNFLAQYLQDGDPSLKPVIIHMETTEDFREENLSTVKSHVIVEVTGWFVDLTLNQFAEYQDRVVIDDRTGTVGSLLKDIQASGGTVTKRCIQLDAGPDEDGHELYVWLRDTADNLLTSVK